MGTLPSDLDPKGYDKVKQSSIKLDLVSESDRQLMATWDWWDTKYTESYRVKWRIQTLLGFWITKVDTEVKVDETDPKSSRQHTFSIPSGTKQVGFSVKPIAKSQRSGSTTKWYDAHWSTEVTYLTSNTPPTKPTIPSVELTDDVDGNKLLLAKLENLDLNATQIHFQVLKRNGTGFDIFKTSNTTIQYVTEEEAANRTGGYARYSCYVEDNGEYKVRARSARGDLTSEWSDYSDSLFAPPTAPSEITTIRASSKTSVYLEWTPVESAETYDIQYVTKRDESDNLNDIFDASERPVTKTDIESTRWDIDGLESGYTYYFRVRAVCEGGASNWTDPVSVVVAIKPGIPTTWPSSSTVVQGEPLVFYWIHNSMDNSKETEATLELTISTIEEIVIPNESVDDETDNRISSYTFDTSGLDYGTTILWRVKTKGIHDDYSEYSVQRTVNVYAKPKLSLLLLDSKDDEISNLTTFPINLTATPTPITQTPISYYLSIIANEDHETVDAAGNVKMVAKGEEIFSRHYDTSKPLSITLSAGDVNFENNVGYTIKCTVTMDSGLIAEDSKIFTTAWADETYWVNAAVSVDTTSYTAAILPYCRNESGAIDENFIMSVYRRNYDGTFTELVRGIPNDGITHISDPHPALDYARYRIVATSKVTGEVYFYDTSGVEVGGTSIVLQWDEAWRNLDNPDESVPFEPFWAGSMLKLPYNIDIREDVSLDVSHIEYIGRQHPVSYYGTHRGESATWSTVIDKNDAETLYALRRLARWAGDVYVREPSGSGYWASVRVSLSQSYDDLTIPVSFDITRVEGGI